MEYLLYNNLKNNILNLQAKSYHIQNGGLRTLDEANWFKNTFMKDISDNQINRAKISSEEIKKRFETFDKILIDLYYENPVNPEKEKAIKAAFNSYIQKYKDFIFKKTYGNDISDIDYYLESSELPDINNFNKSILNLFNIINPDNKPTIDEILEQNERELNLLDTIINSYNTDSEIIAFRTKIDAIYTDIEITGIKYRSTNACDKKITTKTDPAYCITEYDYTRTVHKFTKILDFFIDIKALDDLILKLNAYIPDKTTQTYVATNTEKDTTNIEKDTTKYNESLAKFIDLSSYLARNKEQFESFAPETLRDKIAKIEAGKKAKIAEKAAAVPSKTTPTTPTTPTLPAVPAKAAPSPATPVSAPTPSVSLTPPSATSPPSPPTAVKAAAAPAAAAAASPAVPAKATPTSPAVPAPPSELLAAPAPAPIKKTPRPKQTPDQIFEELKDKLNTNIDTIKNTIISNDNEYYINNKIIIDKIFENIKEHIHKYKLVKDNKFVQRIVVIYQPSMFSKYTIIEFLNDLLTRGFEFSDKITASIKSLLNKQLGGAPNENTIVKYSQSTAILKIIDHVTQINLKIQKFKLEYSELIELSYRYEMYKLYRISLINFSFGSESYIVYDYINRGLCQYYYGILDNIIKKFKDIDSIDKELPIYKGLRYLNLNHYILLYKMHSFLKKLLDDKSFTINSVIDISSSPDDIRINFMLFNRFKDILDSYNETFQSRVTIYARINDKTNIDKDSKMFVANNDNKRILNVNINYKTCPKISSYNKSLAKEFTEVFDTETFKENSTISKYMTLGSQITKGKGIVFITYGYSGTGKTYTLFGRNEPPIMQGLLQSTLENIINVKKIYFRVYEIYGKGLPYTSYWDDNNTVEQSIIIYKNSIVDKINPQTKTIEKEVKILNKPILLKSPETDIKAYMASSEDFIELSDDPLITKQIFQNFSSYIESIDLKRKDGELNDKDNRKLPDIKRIVETANNPESSRSIIIYEFYIYVSDKIIPFILIDLPGRENLIQTYVTSCLEGQLTLKNEAMLSGIVLNPLSYYLYTDTLTKANIIEVSQNILDKDFNRLIGQNEMNNQIKTYTSMLNNTPIENKYNFYNQIYEGIYINENIMSLIKILTQIISPSSEANVPTQDISFDSIVKDMLKLNTQFINNDPNKQFSKKSTKSTKTSHTISDSEKYKEIKEYNYNENLYSPNKIFNPKNNTHILDVIINKYNQESNHNFTYPFNTIKKDYEESYPIAKVDSYKLLYLLTNDDADKKCTFQLELLENTNSLIEAIRN